MYLYQPNTFKDQKHRVRSFLRPGETLIRRNPSRISRGDSRARDRAMRARMHDCGDSIMKTTYILILDRTTQQAYPYEGGTSYDSSESDSQDPQHVPVRYTSMIKGPKHAQDAYLVIQSHKTNSRSFILFKHQTPTP